jgi:hypothetical protein
MARTFAESALPEREASVARPWAVVVGSVAIVAAWCPRVTEEVKILRRELPVAFEELKARVTGNETAQKLIDELPSRECG